MSRSLKKGPYIDYKLEQKVLAMNEFAAALIPFVNRAAIGKVNILTTDKTSVRNIVNSGYR